MSTLFIPKDGRLVPFRDSPVEADLRRSADEVAQSMERMVNSEDYPCIAAIRSFAKDEYYVGLYPSFGTGRSAGQLARDLLVYRDHHRESRSPYLSFWAVFPETGEFTEAEFETRLWHELSCAVSHEVRNGNDPMSSWDPAFSPHPEDRNFCFSLGGSAFFVVGLHAGSSRVSRRFPHPTLIFNVYEQFTQLMDEGKYDPMVRINRLKDLRFQGTVNPMAEKYGVEWEAIQFSGSENPSDWKCPFQHGAKPK